MRKKIKLKKKRLFKLKYLVFLVGIFLSYQLFMYFFTSFKLVTSNEEFIRALLRNSNYHLYYEKTDKNIMNKILSFLSIDINKPTTILKNSFAYQNDDFDSTLVYNDTYNNVQELEKITEYIKDPNPDVIKTPRVYIYNSHQLENYSMNYLEPYNITPNVMMASYLLKEKLNKLGIPTIVEQSNITEFMKANNWQHKDSYKASRFYIIDSLNQNPNLDLIIDLHRDALSKDASTVEIDSKKYAKILFVVGLEHKNYKQNLDLSNKLNDIIAKKYPTLTRGVITKKGETVDGIYNQDINPKMILLEVGGQNNSIDEVLNTMDVISQIIREHLS